MEDIIQYKLERVEIEDKDILYRLLQYSLFEESLTDLNKMNDEAIFEYKWFDNYFQDNNREAYFIREENSNKILGFAMVNQYMQKNKDGHSIAEFMIIPKYRRLKIGKRVAIELFNIHKGNWEVKPSYGSKTAFSFWKYVIKYWNEWNEEIQKNYFDKFINNEKENSYIIQYDNIDIGFYNGNILENGNYEIGNICIIPEYQNKGIGTRILENLLALYKNTDIELQSFKINPVKKLYERLGFNVYEETEFHYKMKKVREGV